MMTTTENKPCGGKQATERVRECVPCDLPPFCRNVYYTGKLLTERDFSDEQRYHIDKWRLHNLAMHGWGVVCGLRVRPHAYCPDRRLVVEPGLAIDGCGREIRLIECVEVELPRQPKKPAEPEPCPPDETDLKQHRQHDSPERDCPEPEPCDPAGTLYLCLRYAECETEFSPKLFDECACGSDGQQANRVCEGYRIEVSQEKPKDWDDAVHARERCETDCEDIYDEMLEPCAKPGRPFCIPLAVVRSYRPGDSVVESAIDMLVRPLLPSGRTLDRLIRCILDKIPVRKLTRIADIGWTHGREYHAYDFRRLFVGDHDSPRAFEVTFSNPVKIEGLSTRSFQAVVVRHDKPDGGFLEVAPSRVSASHDRTKFYLQIDRGYADRCLRGTFDLYLTLRCNLIVDECGLAVDGNLLARLQSDGTYVAAPPTGDGIEGGTFESWIRVLG